MTPNPHPDCPICRLVDAAQGQRIDIAQDVIALALRYTCTCRGTKHRPLAQHPHVADGCQGYAFPASLIVVRKETHA
jgi:hypothetical protein